MIRFSNYLGLASPDGIIAKSSDSLGSVVRSGLAVVAVGVAVAVLTAFGVGPALADHKPSHGGQLQTRVDDLEDGQTDLEALIVDLQAQIDAITKTVFVTSAVFTGDLKTAGAGVDGVDGANNLCQAAADEASSIVPAGTYLAWISDSSVNSPDANFLKSGLPYVLPNGTAVASDYTDLTDGSLLHGISVTERGSFKTGFAWTGTSAGGTPSGNHCDGWASSTGRDRGTTGAARSDIVTSDWSSFSSIPCSIEASLYCVEQ